ncbi:unnamed protein product [Peronospora belbahrii]|uniref:tRNA-binding domain-containing protein n=1 Tax=Peronospora belbahrii TaxID=622444 RepID=A0AAU9KHB5_9STRA|nr:unnamed protein product [Peronospora belbahrii]CAH0515148.1 unnamed protein product [Peronospora belbahrii]
MSAIDQIENLINSLETELGIEATGPIANNHNDSNKQQDQGKTTMMKKTTTKKNWKQSTEVSNLTQPEITKLDIRVGQILKVWKHESATKLYCEEIDVGEEKPRQIASGLVPYYSLEEMQGQRVVVVCNLKPRNLVNFSSHGMVLCGVLAMENQEEKVVFVTPPDGAKIGERITFQGLEGDPLSPAQVEKRKVLLMAGNEMKTDDNGVAKWKDHVFCTSAGPCIASVKNGVIR